MNRREFFKVCMGGISAAVLGTVAAKTVRAGLKPEYAGLQLYLEELERHYLADLQQEYANMLRFLSEQHNAKLAGGKLGV